MTLSYRIYGKLKDTDQIFFNQVREDYYPIERSLALYLWLWYDKDKPLKLKHFRLARRLLPLYEEEIRTKVITTNWLYIYSPEAISIHKKIPPRSNLSFILKELEFQGFVPLNTIRINKKYGYFMTNIPLHGTIYVYPKKFTDSYKTLNRNKPYYQEAMGKIGIMGLTKYQYSEITR